MQEKINKMKELCKAKKEGEYLYSDKLGEKGENYNIFYSTTVSNTNIKVFNDVIKNIVKDENFFWFIEELKKDAQALYKINERASTENREHSYKTWLDRQGCNKYCGTTNRKKLEDMDETSKERIGEYKLFQNYKSKQHHVIGSSRKYQVPIMREANGKRAVDIVFQKDNTIYICELKKSKSKEGILRCICEILTYYFLIGEHIKDDGENKYFYKEFARNYNDNINYKVEPAVICPSSFIKDIDLKPLLDKLYKEFNIDLKIVTIQEDNGILDE